MVDFKKRLRGAKPQISPEIQRAADYLREQDRSAPPPKAKPSRTQLALVAADEYLNQPPAPDAVTAALVGELVELVRVVPAPLDLRLIAVGHPSFMPVSTCDPVDVAIARDEVLDEIDGLRGADLRLGEAITQTEEDAEKIEALEKEVADLEEKLKDREDVYEKRATHAEGLLEEIDCLLDAFCGDALEAGEAYKALLKIKTVVKKANPI